MENTEEKKMVEETNEEKVMPVVLGQVPTGQELVFITPQGTFRQEEYLVWMGNMLVEIKESLAG